jgi:hypothetical protein
MLTKEKYVLGEHIYLVEEKCIKVIEKELDSFFEIRLKSVHLISELYLKGSLRSLNDILNFLNISNDEIKNLMETVVYKISNQIKYDLSYQTIYFNIDSELENYLKYIENSIDEFRRTEKVLSLCEKFLDKSLSKMFGTCCESKSLNYVFNQLNFPEKMLGNNSLKHQKQKHSNIIFEQLKGFILNLKCDLRNDLVKSTLLLVNSIYTYEEESIIA